MALFGPKPLPLTSYGYAPPRGAAVKGWACTNRENCGTGDDYPPARWPVRCPQCGWPCDPTFNEPWAHEAKGIELNWQVCNDPNEYSREIAAQQLLAWRLKDALRRRNPAEAAAARAATRDYVQRRVSGGGYFNPGFTLFDAVWDGIEAVDMDGAADDLCFWGNLPAREGASNDSDVRSNASQLISLASKFFAAPGGSAHPRAAEIRQGALRVVAPCYSDLSRDIQDKVNELSRAESGMVASQRQADMPQCSGPAPGDRISSEQLADFGRYEFLGEQASGIKSADALGLVRALAEPVWTSEPNARASAVAELSRHADRGEWETVGAWKFVREFLDDALDTRALIDGGLAAVTRMRVTNLSIHLSVSDSARYRELTSGPVPNDGFFGPPVFDSHFGPSRQFYLDSAVAAAARRSIARLPHAPGVRPGPVTDAARSLWDFGQVIYRGPLVVNPDIAFEPSAVRHAVIAATNVDHVLFMNAVAAAVTDPANYLLEGYAAIGAARFAEDYLAAEALSAPGYQRLLDAGLTRFLRTGEPGIEVSPLLLTPLQQEQLAQLRADV